MLTNNQVQLVRIASLRSADVEVFSSHLADATAGRSSVTDAELKDIINEALSVARLPYPHAKQFREPMSRHEAYLPRRK